jgi:phosphatidylglycerol---prolipoprotein diacylglyceryl transferase
MWPVLFTVFGIPIQSYGLSKAVAAVVAAWLLGRAFSSRGMRPEDAHAMTVAATVWGFVGAKAYHLAENIDRLTWHHLGGSGFTWYGGLLAGLAAAFVVIRRRCLPVVQVAGLAVAPLSVAYGIGRIGCFLAGDGTYGRPSDVPWAMAFPDGVVPTDTAVHPTPLYEAVGAFALAVALWRLQGRWQPARLVAAYLVVSGFLRFAVEAIRTNAETALGFTQPQLWSVPLVVIGVFIFVHGRRATRPPASDMAAHVAQAPPPTVR